MVGRGKCSLAWGSLSCEQRPPGNPMRLKSPGLPLGYFAQIKPLCLLSGSLSQNHSALPATPHSSAPIPSHASSNLCLLTVTKPGGGELDCEQICGMGTIGGQRNPQLRLHIQTLQQRPPALPISPSIPINPSLFVHTHLRSCPAPLGSDSSLQGAAGPLGVGGRSWEGIGSLGAGLGVGVGKKLGRAPGTSWAMSRGSSREAK